MLSARERNACLHGVRTKGIIWCVPLCCSLIKEGLCDRSSAPSVSAISRLLRGHDGEDPTDKKLIDGKSYITNHTTTLFYFKLWPLFYLVRQFTCE